MPFDRLVRTVDEWAGATRRRDVVAQIGTTSYRPRHLRWTAFLHPTQLRAHILRASAIVAHAGTGSIIAAMECQKPILVMPRRSELRETRNNHQVATVRRLQCLEGVAVAMDERELRERLDELHELVRPVRIGPHASHELISGLRAFVAGLSSPPAAQAIPRETSNGSLAPKPSRRRQPST